MFVSKKNDIGTSPALLVALKLGPRTERFCNPEVFFVPQSNQTIYHRVVTTYH